MEYSDYISGMNFFSEQINKQRERGEVNSPLRAVYRIKKGKQSKSFTIEQFVQKIKKLNLTPDQGRSDLREDRRKFIELKTKFLYLVETKPQIEPLLERVQAEPVQADKKTVIPALLTADHPDHKMLQSVQDNEPNTPVFLQIKTEIIEFIKTKRDLLWSKLERPYRATSLAAQESAIREFEQQKFLYEAAFGISEEDIVEPSRIPTIDRIEEKITEIKEEIKSLREQQLRQTDRYIAELSTYVENLQKVFFSRAEEHSQDYAAITRRFLSAKNVYCQIKGIRDEYHKGQISLPEFKQKMTSIIGSTDVNSIQEHRKFHGFRTFKEIIYDILKSLSTSLASFFKPTGSRKVDDIKHEIDKLKENEYPDERSRPIR